MEKIEKNKFKSDVIIEKLVIYLKFLIMFEVYIVSGFIYMALGAGGMQEFGKAFIETMTMLIMVGLYYVGRQNSDYKKMKRGKIDEQN